MTSAVKLCWLGVQLEQANHSFRVLWPTRQNETDILWPSRRSPLWWQIVTEASAQRLGSIPFMDCLAIRTLRIADAAGKFSRFDMIAEDEVFMLPRFLFDA